MQYLHMYSWTRYTHNVKAIYRNIISHSLLTLPSSTLLCDDLIIILLQVLHCCIRPLQQLDCKVDMSFFIVAVQQIIRLPLWISLDISAPLGSYSYRGDIGRLITTGFHNAHTQSTSKGMEYMESSDQPGCIIHSSHSLSHSPPSLPQLLYKFAMHPPPSLPALAFPA